MDCIWYFVGGYGMGVVTMVTGAIIMYRIKANIKAALEEAKWD